jgi:hypothetical protein
LAQRNIHLRAADLFQSFMTDIGHHANHAPASILGHDLSQRVLSGPKGAGQRLVHDHDGFARCAILLRESSAGFQADPGGFEVSIGDDPNVGFGMLVLRVNLSFAGDLPGAVATERQDVAHSSRMDAGCRSRPLEHVV